MSCLWEVKKRDIDQSFGLKKISISAFMHQLVLVSMFIRHWILLRSEFFSVRSTSSLFFLQTVFFFHVFWREVSQELKKNDVKEKNSRCADLHFMHVGPLEKKRPKKNSVFRSLSKDLNEGPGLKADWRSFKSEAKAPRSRRRALKTKALLATCSPSLIPSRRNSNLLAKRLCGVVTGPNFDFWEIFSILHLSKSKQHFRWRILSPLSSSWIWPRLTHPVQTSQHWESMTRQKVCVDYASAESYPLKTMTKSWHSCWINTMVFTSWW